jgi:hypothetical protein
MEETCTTTPEPRSTIPGTRARSSRTALSRFISRSASQDASGRFRVGIGPVAAPALLTRTSMPPTLSTTRRPSSVAPSSERRSAGMKVAGRSSGGAVREAVSTVAPAAAKRRAVASPSPRLPPVTSTRRPASVSYSIVMGVLLQ